ncbi:hypothetical protein [Cohnella zeiphila]|uniref:Uncharacterized protein n=1 Tax=Cohnella zeiphila TaxID=2761120 RepID=A0A7X0SHB5_9BACL|nr:hypothetical protein [Cohnella zeiphila]MBB6729994.1 hypothetical protein [Cohnella zeiphila]
MGKWGSLLLLVAGAAWLLSGCRSTTMEDAFRQQYPDPGYELLYSEAVGDRYLAFFKSPQPDGTAGIGLAVFEGGRGKGWTVLQTGTFYDPGSLGVDIAQVDLGNEGTKDVVFGYTDNKNVAKIATVDSQGDTVQAELIDTDWKKIWFAVGDIETLNVKAFAADGRVVAQVPDANAEYGS